MKALDKKEKSDGSFKTGEKIDGRRNFLKTTFNGYNKPFWANMAGIVDTMTDDEVHKLYYFITTYQVNLATEQAPGPVDKVLGEEVEKILKKYSKGL
ncbi:MAG: hypothetical protein ACK40G_17310 [Cytophagaceae bacterium]